MNSRSILGVPPPLAGWRGSLVHRQAGRVSPRVTWLVVESIFAVVVVIQLLPHAHSPCSVIVSVFSLNPVNAELAQTSPRCDMRVRQRLKIERARSKPLVAEKYYVVGGERRDEAGESESQHAPRPSADGRRDPAGKAGQDADGRRQYKKR